jgi:hypothetical protein
LHPGIGRVSAPGVGGSEHKPFLIVIRVHLPGQKQLAVIVQTRDAVRLGFASSGLQSPLGIAMIAMTTSNSIKVNARPFFCASIVPATK